MEPSTDRSESEDRTEAERPQGVEEMRPEMDKPKAYLGERTAKVVWQFLLTHDL
ncbi:MAG: hypothetical protein K6A64_01690 [Bacteroidales bacterium]|nr:hypothetical protein [Bacteroidales bacterium]